MNLATSDGFKDLGNLSRFAIISRHYVKYETFIALEITDNQYLNIVSSLNDEGTNTCMASSLCRNKNIH